jgi:hypothetical protein
MSIGHFPLPLFLQLAKTNLYSSLRQATTVRRGISCSISKAQLMSDGIPGVAQMPTIRDERELLLTRLAKPCLDVEGSEAVFTR